MCATTLTIGSSGPSMKFFLGGRGLSWGGRSLGRGWLWCSWWCRAAPQGFPGATDYAIVGVGIRFKKKTLSLWLLPPGPGFACQGGGGGLGLGRGRGGVPPRPTTPAHPQPPPPSSLHHPFLCQLGPLCSYPSDVPQTSVATWPTSHSRGHVAGQILVVVHCPEVMEAS